MGHKAEAIAEIKGNTGTEADLICHSCVTVGATDAEAYTAVNKEADEVGLEICGAGIGVDVESGEFAVAGLAVVHAKDCPEGEFVSEIIAKLRHYGYLGTLEADAAELSGGASEGELTAGIPFAFLCCCSQCHDGHESHKQYFFHNSEN